VLGRAALATLAGYAGVWVTNLWASFERPAARLRHCPRVRSKPYKSQQSLREAFPSRAADQKSKLQRGVDAKPLEGQNPQIKIIALGGDQPRGRLLAQSIPLFTACLFALSHRHQLGYSPCDVFYFLHFNSAGFVCNNTNVCGEQLIRANIAGHI
jgi:hypothetical protein